MQDSLIILNSTYQFEIISKYDEGNHFSYHAHFKNTFLFFCCIRFQLAISELGLFMLEILQAWFMHTSKPEVLKLQVSATLGPHEP